MFKFNATTVHHIQAVDIQKEELYAEPSYFFQPAKPCLGAVLLEEGRKAEAEEMFLEDLRELPENAWSLAGLQEVKGKAVAKSGARVSSSCPAFLS